MLRFVRSWLLTSCLLGAGCALSDWDDISGVCQSEVCRDAGREGDAGSPLGPCEGESCLAAPEVEGEPSAGHTDVTFRWSVPSGTVQFELQVDARTPEVRPASTTSLTTELNQGAHRFRVRACDANDLCSPYGSFETTVEFLGGPEGSPFEDVARTIAASPLGNAVAVSCHNCFNALPYDVLPAAEARAQIAAAVTNQADFVEIDVIEVAGTMYASTTHPDDVTGLPTLAELLGDATLAQSSSMLMLEITDTSLDFTAFARTLVAVLKAHPDYVQNGRPLFVKVFDDRIDYALALREALRAEPFLAPYVRYWVLLTEVADASDAQMRIDDKVLAHDLDGVEVYARTSSLSAILGYAREKGLGAGVYGVPGPGFGEVIISTMRESVDLLTTEYRVDLARALVSQSNVIAWLDARKASPASLPVWRDEGGTLTESMRPLNVMATELGYGAPSWFDAGRGQSMFGGALDFQVARATALSLGAKLAPGAGMIVDAVVTFRDFAAMELGTLRSIVSNAEMGGFKLDLARPSSGNTNIRLRMGVHVGGAYVYTDYFLAGAATVGCPDSRNGAFTAPLREDQAYHLTGLYSPEGVLRLFIDNQCAAGPSRELSGAYLESPKEILVGAEPRNTANRAVSHFEGTLQTAGVLRWNTPSEQGTNR